jgi:hypothetical protein
MHNLGLRDAICESIGEIEPAAFLMLNFLGYVYEADPTIADGDAVGAEGVPLFRVYREPCDLHEESDPFYNPYGMWRIRVVDDRAPKGLEVRHPFLKKLPTHPAEKRV